MASVHGNQGSQTACPAGEVKDIPTFPCVPLEDDGMALCIATYAEHHSGERITITHAIS